ncbi:hypothetical protein SRABI80_02431 [Peribacillus frigoritolerans]|nr:hypothetical protein [Peribacillus frigoritolerans]CAH0227258.1 hypothetical protein SRABI80_02431 [Peribacillus frigoritolerans]
MNFKMQNKQNQLIERITNRHLVVGIDIAQHESIKMVSHNEQKR